MICFSGRSIVLATALFGLTSTAPADPPAPALETLSRETQALYAAVKPGLVRVQFPLPPMAAAPTQPSTTPSTQNAVADSERSKYEALLSSLIAPRTTGLIVDESGHVVIPLYIDPDVVLAMPFKVWSEAAGLVEAKLVGSDRQTNLSVLKLERPIGKPVPLHGSKPPEGSLVMVLAAWGEAGKLAVWTGAQSERGLIVSAQGAITGFARGGQFLSADDALPVINQLIQYRMVRRAMLGVTVQQLETPDGRRAMHVDQVQPNSPAELAGVKVGDYILSVYDKPADDLLSFAAAISAAEGVTPIRILRDKAVVELKIEFHSSAK